MPEARSPLRAVLDRYVDEYISAERATEDVSTWIEKEATVIESHEMQDAVRLVATSAAINAAENVITALSELMVVCDSPLERLFLPSLVLAFMSRFGGGAAWRLKDSVVVELTPTRAVVQPQVKIGDYRVDFLVKTEEQFDWNSYMVATTIVELDGHDFHEKTKEQAARDKKRDRVLQAAGHSVLRFTGSEVWRDPLKCALEVVEYLENNEEREDR